MKSFLSKLGYWLFMGIASILLFSAGLYLIMTLASNVAAPQNNTEKIWLFLTVALIIGVSALFYNIARFIRNWGFEKSPYTRIVNPRRFKLLRYFWGALAALLFCISVMSFYFSPKETSMQHSDEWEGTHFLGVLFLFNALFCIYKVWRLSKRISEAKT